ncbi:MAG: transposase [Mycobacterium sp.]|uniref:transposase n=1 Tax=Mycobacterium sp. TaxID=1785 RepID=UPI003899AA2F
MAAAVGRSMWTRTSADDLLPIIKANVAPGTHVMTDEAGQYAYLGRNRHERATDTPSGYRNGTRERRLLGSFGPVQISVPRARMTADVNRRRKLTPDRRPKLTPVHCACSSSP